jgi:hypothetical protein
MPKPPPRTFSRDFKLKALDRLDRGETISALSAEFGVQVWAYCFMPNHVHLILSPSTAEVAFRKAMQAIRSAEVIGRPLGRADFIADLECRLGRPLARRAPGRKPRPPSAEQPLLL